MSADNTSPLTATELADYNRQRNERAGCCTGNCERGDRCPMRMPAEACTEMGVDPDPKYQPASWAVELALAVGAFAVIGAVQTVRWLAGLL